MKTNTSPTLYGSAHLHTNAHSPILRCKKENASKQSILCLCQHCDSIGCSLWNVPIKEMYILQKWSLIPKYWVWHKHLKITLSNNCSQKGKGGSFRRREEVKLTQRKNGSPIKQLKAAAAAAAKLLQLCLTLRPHRRNPTRLPHPWDSPGKNTGVDCHFLLQCMKVKSQSEVTQSCSTQRPHGLQLTRLLRPWDFPGKSTGVGCHRLLPALSYRGLNKA